MTDTECVDDRERVFVTVPLLLCDADVVAEGHEEIEVVADDERHKVGEDV